MNARAWSAEGVGTVCSVVAGRTDYHRRFSLSFFCFGVRKVVRCLVLLLLMLLLV